MNKHSVQLDDTISRVESCGNTALVEIGSRGWDAKIIGIDLKTLTPSLLHDLLYAYGWFGCDESTGQYYVVNEEKLSDRTVKLSAYQNFNTKNAQWQFTMSSRLDTGGNVFDQAIVTQNSIVVMTWTWRYYSDELIYEVNSLDKLTGKLLWHFKVPSHMDDFGHHIVMKPLNNLLILKNEKGYMEAYNLENGAMLWEINNLKYAEYFEPLFDAKTNTIITGIKRDLGNYSYIEVIGIHPITGKIKWTLDETHNIGVLDFDPKTATLIYLQGISPIYKLNWYRLVDQSIEPILLTQWKHKDAYSRPTEFIIAGDYIILSLYHDNSKQSFLIFDMNGKKIKEVESDFKLHAMFNYNKILNITTYASDREFGILDWI